MTRFEFIQAFHRAVVYAYREVNREKNITTAIMMSREFLRMGLRDNLIEPTDQLIALGAEIIKEKRQFKIDYLQMVVWVEEAYDSYTRSLVPPAVHDV